MRENPKRSVGDQLHLIFLGRVAQDFAVGEITKVTPSGQFTVAIPKHGDVRFMPDGGQIGVDRGGWLPARWTIVSAGEWARQRAIAAPGALVRKLAPKAEKIAQALRSGDASRDLALERLSTARKDVVLLLLAFDEGLASLPEAPEEARDA